MLGCKLRFLAFFLLTYILYAPRKNAENPNFRHSLKKILTKLQVPNFFRKAEGEEELGLLPRFGLV
jgi:hypothetical protein